jgi:hypothetical protein
MMQLKLNQLVMKDMKINSHLQLTYRKRAADTLEMATMQCLPFTVIFAKPLAPAPASRPGP